MLKGELNQSSSTIIPQNHQSVVADLFTCAQKPKKKHGRPKL
jgi:hypothetical protein